MEIIQFANNVEFVQKARELLEAPEGYAYSYNHSNNNCYYRMLDTDNKERRCIVGRMLYGHIPEDHPIWKRLGDIISMAEDYPDIRKKLPQLSWPVAERVQQAHDSKAIDPLKVYDWSEVEELAADYDETYAER